MSRGRALAILGVGVVGYVLLAWLFPRFSTGAQWNIRHGAEESIAQARGVAAKHGFDVTGWSAESAVLVDRKLNDARVLIGFRHPTIDDEAIGIRFDPSGRPTAVVHRRESRAGDDVTVGAARPLAERALRDFVPNAAEYRSVAQEDLGADGVRFRWERKPTTRSGTDPKLVWRAKAIVAGASVRDIRYELEESEQGDDDTPVDVLDAISDITVILAGLFGFVLYVVASGRHQIPQRLALTLAGIAWLVLFVEMFSSLDPQLAAVVSDSNNNSARWALILAAAFVAIPGALAVMGGYPSTRRRFPRQLLSFEELLLRGRIASRSVGTALLTGIAAGGWIAVVPHLLRGTGLFGNYRIDDAFDDPLFLSGALPLELYSAVIVTLIAFALIGSFVQDKLRGVMGGATGTIVAFVLALIVVSNDDVPHIVPTILAAAIVAFIFDQLLRRGDLLTLIAAAASSAWAVNAASRLVQPAQSIRADGWIVVLIGIAIAAAALAIALWGSVKPYLPWEPRPARAERERIQAEFDVARQAQEQMLPATAPELPGTSIASFCRPARQVGGDLYDFVTMSDGTVGITVADVSGKGVPAALVMTITKGLLLAASDGRIDPLETLADVNAGIHSLRNRSVFVTMLFGVFDPVARTFRFVRAGHTPLLWRKATGEVTMLSPRGIGIGMTGPRTFSALCEQATITTASGDFLILYSDGVNEAMNEHREEFGDDRLFATVRDHITDSMTAEEARAVLVNAVDDFRGAAPAHDDMTLVVVKC
ncbi:MAG: PP2C family protein-serine/threonine phosphatase [Acidobacteriota bacterium]|nr:PP2C family protein-serine/threonine phosphatase [Acidobacteriota bacterium]